MPFPGMFIEDSEIKRLLLDEYEKVEILDLDASFQAYLKESGATENNARELAKQFYGKDIPDSCKIHDIKQTTIYRVLSSVHKCRKSFEDKAIDKNSVIAQAVDLAVQPIFRELDKIPGSCSRFVIPFVEFSEEDELRAAHRIKKTMNAQNSTECLIHYRDAAAAFNNALAGYDINDLKDRQPHENQQLTQQEDGLTIEKIYDHWKSREDNPFLGWSLENFHQKANDKDLHNAPVKIGNKQKIGYTIYLIGKSGLMPNGWLSQYAVKLKTTERDLGKHPDKKLQDITKS